MSYHLRAIFPILPQQLVEKQGEATPELLDMERILLERMTQKGK